MTMLPRPDRALHLAPQGRMGIRRTCLKCGRDDTAWQPGDGSTHRPQEWRLAVNRCTPETS